MFTSQIQSFPTPQLWFSQSIAEMLPSGVILLWSGTIATIPSGYVLCNGSNGTPNLLNRFIVGASADQDGAAKTTVTGSPTISGGQISHTHDAASSPHNHAITDPGHAHAVTPPVAVAPSASTGLAFSDEGGFTGSNTTGITVNNATVEVGVDAAETLPPYFALAYIMKT